MLSTLLPTLGTFRGRRLISYLFCLVLLSLQSCASDPVQNQGPPPITSGYFAMQDGTRLPYRVWSPAKSPSAVILALHGMNDSRDAWDTPRQHLRRPGWLYIPRTKGASAPRQPEVSGQVLKRWLTTRVQKPMTCT